LWDQPLKCAKFIDKFTSHNLKDSTEFNLQEYTRNDLERIIHLLHGFYTQFVHEDPALQEYLHCNFLEVLEAMSLTESFFLNASGELCIDKVSWRHIIENPHLIQTLLQLSQLI
jgi:hypothetical protein